MIVARDKWSQAVHASIVEIKSNKEQYKNKFELVDYVKRTTKEMLGVLVAEPIVPVYLVRR